MAKTHSTIGKDLSDVQSSLWQNRAVKIMSSMDNGLLGVAVSGGGAVARDHSSQSGGGGGGSGGGSGGRESGNLPMSPLQKQRAASITSSKMSRAMMNNSVRREVFVDLEALNRPVSADLSGSGTNLPIMSMRRRFVNFSSSSPGSDGNRGTHHNGGGGEDLGGGFGGGGKQYDDGHNLFDNAHHAGYHHRNTYGGAGESKGGTSSAAPAAARMHSSTPSSSFQSSWAAAGDRYDNYKIDEVDDEDDGEERLVTRGELKRHSEAARRARMRAQAEAQQEARKREEMIEMALGGADEAGSLISRAEAEMFGLMR
jgi:hypothetical protein